MRVTKAGVTEPEGQRDWQHPEHAKKGRHSVFDNITLGPLTDRQIDRYVKQGVYSNRRYYRGELKKLRQLQNSFKPQPRLVYNPTTQEFEERDF